MIRARATQWKLNTQTFLMWKKATVKISRSMVLGHMHMDSSGRTPSWTKINTFHLHPPHSLATHTLHTHMHTHTHTHTHRCPSPSSPHVLSLPSPSTCSPLHTPPPSPHPLYTPLKTLNTWVPGHQEGGEEDHQDNEPSEILHSCYKFCTFYFTWRFYAKYTCMAWEKILQLSHSMQDGHACFGQYTTLNNCTNAWFKSIISSSHPTFGLGLSWE